MAPGDSRSTATAEVAELKKPFLIGVAVVLVAMAALGFVIHQANAGNDRPEGAAERWLAAVGDTTRKGVGSDARKRAEEIGALALAAPLLEGAKTDGKVAFPDLEVGGATEPGLDAMLALVDPPAQAELRRNVDRLQGTDGAHLIERYARVPYRLHLRAGDDNLVREGVVQLARKDGWHVVGLAPARPGEKVPSEGGPVPSRAPLGAFVGAVLLGVGVAAGCAGLIRWAGR
jgi:hypothetical protein